MKKYPAELYVKRVEEDESDYFIVLGGPDDTEFDDGDVVGKYALQSEVTKETKIVVTERKPQTKGK
jgi:hypothetical protein